MSGRESRVNSEAVLLGLGCFVIVSWVLLVAFVVAFPNHTIPTEVHGIVFVIATGLFGSAALAARKGDKGA